jgi:hypothetical protein
MRTIWRDRVTQVTGVVPLTPLGRLVLVVLGPAVALRPELAAALRSQAMTA